MDYARQLKEQVRTIEDELEKVEAQLTDLLLTIPNWASPRSVDTSP